MLAPLAGLAALVLMSGVAVASQQLLPTKTMLVKNPPSGTTKVLWKVAQPSSSATVVGDPVADGATLHVVLTAGGDQCYTLPSSGWTAISTIGFKYKDPSLANGPVKVALIKKAPSQTFIVKAIVQNGGIVPGGPSTSYATNLTLGTGDEYCGGSAGAIPNPNNGITFKVKNDGAPVACVASCTATTSTTSSTNTSTTSTTSSTVPGPCCNNDSFISFTSNSAAGDCGDILNTSGALVSNIACGGLYSGGSGSSVPQPTTLPDLTRTILSMASCGGGGATLGPTTSTATGSNRWCTSPGCLFGAPLPIPNPSSTATSTCVLQTFSAPASGTVTCATGATSLSLPLNWTFYLTGDAATDAGGTIAGIQPCPLCSAGTCVGGTNNGMACIPQTTFIGTAYPTSNDCPPDPMFSIGTIPIALSLSTGTVSWTGTTATNDTGSTASVQTRVFSGYCRDANGTFIFENPAHQCWENGMAVNAACSGVYESCEQRIQGAFGVGGGSSKTITAIGASSSVIGGPAPATLVGLFSIAPTFNPTVDASHDLPGPGAVAFRGTADTCPVANPCP